MSFSRDYWRLISNGSNVIITIDGPTASGKSTVAKRLAEKLGFHFLGTGLMFRGLAYLLIKKSSYDQDALCNPRSEDLSIYLDAERFVYDLANSGDIFFDKQNITPFLKTSEIDTAASVLSTNGLVRMALLKIQQQCGKQCNLVAEGRDVGSVIFPHAQIKFFLTASPLVRAQRWQVFQAAKGNLFSLEQALEIISVRDERDSSRSLAPLIKAEGAIEIDNSEMNFEETLTKMLSFIK